MVLVKYAVIVLFTCFLTLSSGFSQSAGVKLRIFSVQHRNAQLLYTVVKDLISEQGKVTLDAQTNSLIVLDYPENLVNIENVISSLDVQEKNVEIKVLVAETSGNFFNNIGLEGGQVIIPSGKFSAVLAGLRADNTSNIRSEMTVKTLSGYPASLAVSKDEIFGQTVTYYGSHKSDVVVVSDLRQPMGDFLEVLPTVNNDGTITVVVQPTISRMENAEPYQNTVLTQVIINNGDTIVLGGLDKQAIQSQSRKTTIFGVPISQRTNQQHRKTALFLTATIAD